MHQNEVGCREKKITSVDNQLARFASLGQELRSAITSLTEIVEVGGRIAQVEYDGNPKEVARERPLPVGELLARHNDLLEDHIKQLAVISLRLAEALGEAKILG